MAAGARNPDVDFLEDQILLPKAFPSLPASFSLCVSFSLSALYGSKLAGVGLGRGCQRKSDGMWGRTGDGKCGFYLASPGLAFPTLGWPCLSPGPQHLSVAHLPAVTLAQANHAHSFQAAPPNPLPLHALQQIARRPLSFPSPSLIFLSLRVLVLATPPGEKRTEK